MKCRIMSSNLDDTIKFHEKKRNLSKTQKQTQDVPEKNLQIHMNHKKSSQNKWGFIIEPLFIMDLPNSAKKPINNRQINAIILLFCLK